MSGSKWRLIEAVVTAIEGAEPGATVTGNAHVRSRTDPRETRQVDVYIVTQVGRRTLTLGVEVKDERDPLDIVTVEQVAAKLADVEIDVPWLVSTSGFTAGARSKARRAGLRLSTLEQVEAATWTPFTVLRSSAEPVHLQINYDGGPTPELAAAILGTPLSEVFLVEHNGTRTSIDNFALAWGRTSLERLEAPLVDQQPFIVRLNTPSDVWSGLEIRNEMFPPPTHVLVLYRFHQTLESYEMQGYRLDDREIRITTSPVEVFGKLRHLGFLTGPAQDGATQLKLTMTIPNPPKLTIGADEDL